MADKSTSQPAAAGSLFRIASVSKPITAVTILKLYEDGLLGLDEKAFKILEDLEPPSGGVVDPRIYQITIRDLLQHSGGWDSSLSGDPMFKSREIAQTMGVPSASQRVRLRCPLRSNLRPEVRRLVDKNRYIVYFIFVFLWKNIVLAKRYRLCAQLGARGSG